MWSNPLAISRQVALNVAILMALTVGVVLTVWPEAGWAQSSSGRKVIRLEAIKVEGRIQKPQAFYILQRSSLNFEEIDVKRSFLPKVLKSIELSPF